MRTSWGSATDRGAIRRLNEDSLLADPPIFLVADGMGGHSAGDVASQVAVAEFSRLAGRSSVSADDVHACFRASARRLRETVVTGTAGTTVAGAAIATHDGGSYWLVFNVGDSRVYRLGDDGLEQVSVDHSVVQELVDSGVIDRDQAAVHPDRNVITRAVGTGPEPEPDYWLIPARTGDRVLVCSDGLTSEVADGSLQHLLMSVRDPQEAAEALVAAALAAGGHDNVSAIVVDVVETLVTTRPPDAVDDTGPRHHREGAAVRPTPTAREALP